MSHKIIGLTATHHTNHQKGCDATSYGQEFCGAWHQCMSRGIETILTSEEARVSEDIPKRAEPDSAIR